MFWIKAVVLSTLAAASWCDELEFPPGIKFGAATAAYQIEGAWDVSDKSESIWDRFTHTVTGVFAGVTGDEACESYRLWRRDVEMAKELGLQFYRFSIAWTRLLPTGFPNKVSEDGKRYYSDLIDELLRNDIEPVVTLYHWDLPQSLQDLGGWTNPLVAEWFADYAAVAYSLYADRVKTWITINEPIIICDMAYRTGTMAPGVQNLDVAPYLCTKNLLLAHAKAWRIYDEEYKPKYQGQVSVGNHLVWYEPYSDEDREITVLAQEFTIGRFSHPIYSAEGGWPPLLETTMEQLSIRAGYQRSRLPAFTNEEIELIRGTYDYYGFNHYTSRRVRRSRPGDAVPVDWSVPFFGDQELGYYLEGREDWPVASNGWLMVYPEGIRKQLVWLKERYGDIKFFIAESGYCTEGYNLNDTERIQYYRDYLEQVLLAMQQDNVNVIGYTAWTLMDNFEWVGDAYETKFGLYQVDFEDPERARRPRSSAQFYKQLLATRTLPSPRSEL